MVEKSVAETLLPEEPSWYRLSFPHFLHPLNANVQSVTIFLVVAISAERYCAICHPLSHRYVHVYCIE